MHEELRAWYRIQQATREPWDGPAGLIYYDGRWLIAHLDRNGLRPLFVQETGGYGGPRQVIVASEQGVTEWPGEDVIYTGQLGPGEMLAVDMHTGRCYHDKEIKAELDRPVQRLAQPGRPPHPGRRHRPLSPPCPGRRSLHPRADRRRRHPGRPHLLRGPDGPRQQGGRLEHGRRFPAHPLRAAPAHAGGPPPPALRPGHQPAHRSLPRGAGVQHQGLPGQARRLLRRGDLPARAIELESPVLSGPRFSWITRQEAVEHLTFRFPVGNGHDRRRRLRGRPWGPGAKRPGGGACRCQGADPQRPHAARPEAARTAWRPALRPARREVGGLRSPRAGAGGRRRARRDPDAAGGVPHPPPADRRGAARPRGPGGRYRRSPGTSTISPAS